MHEELLSRCYQAAKDESDWLERTQPLENLEAIIVSQQSNGGGFVRAILEREDVSVIAEHKRASPTEGEIRSSGSVRCTVEQYQQGGAIALSILTNTYFEGSIEDVFEARQASILPILRKDFISTEYQLYQAKAYGADAALLIVGGLSPNRLAQLSQEAEAIGLDCLIEAHDETELEVALDNQTERTIVGINNRGLITSEVDINNARKLSAHLPPGTPFVAESGYSVSNPEHIEELREMGASGVLMGTDLMRTPRPAFALQKWLSHNKQSG